jgi:aldehyde:ferredoxin oxidoreductase
MTVARHLVVDLDALQGGSTTCCPVRPWSSPSPALGQLGSWGGPAAALVELVRGAPGLRLAVGPTVARGLPTAARLVVLGRSPRSGRVQQGSVGSDLGPRLAASCDLVSLRGRARGPGAVVVIGAEGAHLRHLPELAGAPADSLQTRLTQRFGPCASLRIGPAGEAGVGWANLAAGDSPASFVGRGGLGALLAEHGLKAVVVTSPPVEPGASGAPLAARLVTSPRLVERAAGGTFELARAREVRAGRDPRVGDSLRSALAERRTGRAGCRGCPTPCGWTFEVTDRSTRARQGARFSAVHALGQALGLEPEHALDLLARCNGLGIDAKEAGVVLELCAQSGQTTDFEELLERIGRGELAAEGAAALAVELGLPDPTASGETVRAETDLATLLGTWAAVRGAEPMRSSAFLLEGGRARLAAALAPLELPVGAELPDQPQGKGRIVWWHENLAAAVDASGFCAFAAAGALADGVLSLDELAGWLGGPGVDGAALLRRGAVLAALVAEGAHRELPEHAPAALGEPGMAAEYRHLRGLDGAGRQRSEARAEAVLAGSWAPALDPEPAPVPSRGPRKEQRRAAGRVTFGTTGALAQGLGPDPCLELPLPASVGEVLVAAGLRWPRAAKLLSDGEGGPRVAVYLEGRRLGAGDDVVDGDRLELVAVVAGG